MTDRQQILSADTHRDLRIRTDRGAATGDAVMAGIVVPDEFRQVQGDYPILFRLNAERDSFTALALFGFEDGENLFLGPDGWDARSLPLSIAIQPFLIGRVESDADAAQVHIDMASPRIAQDGQEGVRAFDADGRATPYLERTIALLGSLDAGYRAMGDFFDALRRHELIEPLSLEITLDDGSTNSLIGFHAIDEERLRALDGHALVELHTAGHLMPIFMALASLGRIGALVQRKNRTLRHGGG